MELILGVVADAVNKTADDKLNILGVFHTIYSAQFPMVHPHLALALEFRAAPIEKGKSFDFDIALRGPDAQIVAQINGNVQISKDAPMLRPIVAMDMNLHNCGFPVEGNYRFEVKINGELKGEVPLEAVRFSGANAGANPNPNAEEIR